MIERAWANTWATFVWRPRDWFYADRWTGGDTTLLATIVVILLFLGLVIFRG